MNKKTIVCFGDSNTHGYCSLTDGRYDEETRWPCLLQQLAGEAYSIREEGLSGRTTCFEDPLFEGLSGLSMINPILMTHEPVDLLIVMLGTNDSKIRFHATPANIGQGLERLIEKVIATPRAFRNQKPNILIITPPPIDPRYRETPVYDTMGPDCDQKTAALAPYFEEVARLHGCRYLDAGATGISMGESDWMHLRPEGHRQLAELIASLLPSICA